MAHKIPAPMKDTNKPTVFIQRDGQPVPAQIKALGCKVLNTDDYWNAMPEYLRRGFDNGTINPLNTHTNADFNDYMDKGHPRVEDVSRLLSDVTTIALDR
jgi:hypothetical protein